MNLYDKTVAYIGWLIAKKERFVSKHIWQNFQIALSKSVYFFGRVNADALSFYFFGSLQPLICQYWIKNITEHNTEKKHALRKKKVHDITTQSK